MKRDRSRGGGGGGGGGEGGWAREESPGVRGGLEELDGGGRKGTAGGIGGRNLICPVGSKTVGEESGKSARPTLGFRESPQEVVIKSPNNGSPESSVPELTKPNSLQNKRFKTRETSVSSAASVEMF